MRVHASWVCQDLKGRREKKACILDTDNRQVKVFRVYINKIPKLKEKGGKRDERKY